MKKILILQNELSPYSVPVYNKIAEHYDLTVGYYLKDKSYGICNFHKKHFDYIETCSFVIVKGLKSYVSQFDLVSILPDLHIISYWSLLFMPHSFKITSWSIGFRVSYVHPYITNRKHVIADRLIQEFFNRCDANIFYMEKAKEFWKDTNVDMSKVFVAPNTTEVIPITIEDGNKKDFLFIGTLYKGKGIDLLLESFLKAVKVDGIDNKLHIVGDGEERNEIETFVKEHHMEDKVILHGAIFDEKKLAELFGISLLCISPTQGGLSCPKSMGYGVPFVTRSDAITGGEIYHITSGVNGVIYKHDIDLTSIIRDASLNREKYIEMGKRAQKYYYNKATINHMAEGAMSAFDFALNIK